MVEIYYPKLSYEIVGILYEVYNKLGYGLREKTYEQIIADCLKEKNIKFKEQFKVEFKFNDRLIKRLFFDFLIDDKIILEIKAKENFDKENIAQVYEYLKAKKLKLGIIANFTKKCVKTKRIIHKIEDRIR